MFCVKDPFLFGVYSSVAASFYMQAVMLAMSEKPLSIYPDVCMGTWLVIGPLTFSGHKILSNMPQSKFRGVFYHLTSYIHNSPT